MAEKRQVTALISVEFEGIRGYEANDANDAIRRVLTTGTDPSCHTVRDAFDTVGGTVTSVTTEVSDRSHGDAPSFDTVMSLARRWYYGIVRDITDDLIERCSGDRAKRERAPGEDPRDWLSEEVSAACDDPQCVIYTAQAGMVLAVSDNDGAYESEMGESTENVSARASMALRADVWQLLEARRDEWEEEEEEEES